MCIVPGSQLYVRRDYNQLISGVLPDIAKTNVSPAQHMNYGGAGDYKGSGYLSLFQYSPKQTCVPDGRNLRQAAAYAISTVSGSHIHFFFIPPGVPVTSLNEDNVRHVPKTGRAASLLDTSQCRPPARINMDGDVVEYANRYIDEFLYTGQWAQGIKVVTERSDSSYILYLMAMRTSLDEICKAAEKAVPCHSGNNGPGPGPGAGAGAGVGGSCGIPAM